MHRCVCHVVEVNREHKIVFIEDFANVTGAMSITNDAENVLRHFQEQHSGDWRVVYKDTDGEWWEIVNEPSLLSYDIVFKPWNGLVWDILSRKEIK